MVRYDPYTDRFIMDDSTKEITATINLNALPKAIIQRNVVEVSDASIEKIADAVVRKLADREDEPQTSGIPYKIETSSVCKTEPQYDFGEYADRLWKIAYERGKREALEQMERSE